MPLHLITGHSNEPHITSGDVGSFNAGIFGGGEFVLDRGRKFEIEVVNNNLVKIYDGDLIMQGRHMSLQSGSTEELAIENGTADRNRIDLIVARYKQDVATGIESAEFAVIKGTATAGTAVTPEYTHGDILNGGCAVNEMPLYKIPISGISIGEPEKVFNVSGAVSKSGDTMTGTLILKRLFGDTAETGGLFPSAYTIGSERSFAITRMINEAVESMLFFNKNGLGLFDAVNNEYSYFARMVKGTYIGDNNESQFIDLGFTPSVVIVMRTDGATRNHDPNREVPSYYGGIATNETKCAEWYNGEQKPIISIENNGFRVYSLTLKNDNRTLLSILTNVNSSFNYIAFR